MLEKVVQTTADLLRLAQDVQQNRGEIKDLRTEMRDLVALVQRLQLSVDQVHEREEQARQMFMLQVENLLLRQRELLALPQGAGAGEP